MTRKSTRNLAARAGFPAAVLTLIALTILACFSAAPAAAQGGNPIWTQQTELTPAGPGGLYGRSVAVEGNIAVVGEPQAIAGPNSLPQGAAYIFVNNGGVWTQQAELTPADGFSYDFFGFSVSISGNTVAVGAWNHPNSTGNEGAVYIFVNNGGAWTQSAELIASDGVSSDQFGFSLALKGDSLVVGDPARRINDNQVGGAYVFTNNGGVWTQQAELLAADGQSGDVFGLSVSLDGANVLVGAPYKTIIADKPQQGLVYVFTQSNGVWSQYTELIAPDGAAGSGFGYSVALSGTTALIGAINALGFGAASPGSVYIWELDFGTWSNSAELQASDASVGDFFGNSVSLDSTNSRFIVGAPNKAFNSNEYGAAYAFARIGGTWTQQTELTGAQISPGSVFGLSVAIDGTTILVGAPQPVNSSYGAVYVYTEAPTQLQITQEPAVGTVGSAIDPVLVQLEDAAGNPLTTSGVAVTLASDPAGVSGTLTLNTTNGVAEFDGLTFSSANTYTLSASASGLTSATGSSIQISQVTQTITFGALSGQTLGAAPFPVSATASSGLPVSFASLTSGVCAVSGNTVTLFAAGQCTIEASQSGNASYSAATPVDQSFQITKQAQTITFGALPNQTLGAAPFPVSATASSGLPVSFASLTGSICSASGNTVTLLAAGQCTIEARQAGNATYSAATPVDQSFQVASSTKLTQYIVFPYIPDQVMGSAPVAITASASSGLPVSFASLTPSICGYSGDLVTLLHAGTCTIRATQPGNSVYKAAPAQNRSFKITKQIQAITFPAIPMQVYNYLSTTAVASASSGLPVTFTSSTTTDCTVTSAGLVTFKHVGYCTITARQAGNIDFQAAAPVSQTFLIEQGYQEITFAPIPDQPYYGKVSLVPLYATASSGLQVKFTSLTPTVCGLARNTTTGKVSATLLGSGVCTIEADQAGNVDYRAASPAGQSFNSISFVGVGSF